MPVFATLGVVVSRVPGSARESEPACQAVVRCIAYMEQILSCIDASPVVLFEVVASGLVEIPDMTGRKVCLLELARTGVFDEVGRCESARGWHDADLRRD